MSRTRTVVAPVAHRDTPFQTNGNHSCSASAGSEPLGEPVGQQEGVQSGVEQRRVDTEAVMVPGGLGQRHLGEQTPGHRATLPEAPGTTARTRIPAAAACS